MKKWMKCLLGTLMTLSLTQCSENGGLFNCTCTERSCPMVTNPFIILNLDLEEYPELLLDELQDVRVIQTNRTFDPIDTVNLQFAPVSFGSSLLQLRIAEKFAVSPAEYLESNLIIQNLGIGQVDTISSIQYNITNTEEVCNECSGGPVCKDELFTARSFDSPQLLFNATPYNRFEIPYVIKE